MYFLYVPGSPPKDSLQGGMDDGPGGDGPRISSFDPDNERPSHMGRDDMLGMGLMNPPSHIPSILDMDLQPTPDMEEKLAAGLYEQLTAPLSDSEEDRFSSPPHR